MDKSQEKIKYLEEYLNTQVIGQERLVQRLLIALLADGHLLVEGAPGLAKTRLIKGLAVGIEARFHRIQFTPDLLPSDLTGTDIFHPENGSFAFLPGPLFHHLVLADEINRAPAKVQSALLEAMAEHQVTIGSKTYPLPELFLVLATQNPIEQEGTYPLPEAQLDRFLLYVKVDYPDASVESQILNLARQEAKRASLNLVPPKEILLQAQLFEARQDVLNVFTSDALTQYMIDLVVASRYPKRYAESSLSQWLRFGASPRATIALDRCSKAHAWLLGRDFVTPEDIHAIIYDVMRHRLLLTFEAEAEGIQTEQLIDELIKWVALP
jgi:MoxR-like ATPase